MRRIRMAALGLAAWLVSTALGDDQPAGGGPAPRVAARQWFEDARFGLFLHWGVDSLLGKGEWVMDHDKIPVAEYEKLPPRFNPTEFDAEAWVKAAKGAGARYLTVVAKHHDGFCMFDSRLTRYDVVDATPYGKDPLKAMADACRRHGLKLFVSYSLLDWHHPDYFPRGKTGRAAGREGRGNWKAYVAYYQGQVRELCTRYGPIGGVRFEGRWDRPDADWDLEATSRMVHELQPGALVGDNQPAAPVPGQDFRTSAGDPAGWKDDGPGAAPPLELSLTLNDSRGYNASDKHFKSAEQVIHALLGAAGRGANLLLTVGPGPDGALGPEPTDRLTAVGKWLDRYGETVYGTRRGPVPPQPWGVSVTSAARGQPTFAYLHVLNPTAPIELPETFLSFDARPYGATDFLQTRQADRLLEVVLPEKARTPVDTVIVLTTKVLAPARPSRR
jgi:alpha-L-fucosidase